MLKQLRTKLNAYEEKSVLDPGMNFAQKIVYGEFFRQMDLKNRIVSFNKENPNTSISATDAKALETLWAICKSLMENLRYGKGLDEGIRQRLEKLYGTHEKLFDFSILGKQSVLPPNLYLQTQKLLVVLKTRAEEELHQTSQQFVRRYHDKFGGGKAYDPKQDPLWGKTLGQIDRQDWKKLMALDLKWRESEIQSTGQEEAHLEILEQLNMEEFYPPELVEEWEIQATQIRAGKLEKSYSTVEKFCTEHKGFLNGFDTEVVYFLNRMERDSSEHQQVGAHENSLFGSGGLFKFMYGTVDEDWDKFLKVLQIYFGRNPEDQLSKLMQSESFKMELFVSLRKYGQKKNLLALSEVLLDMRRESIDPTFVAQVLKSKNINRTQQEIALWTPEHFVNYSQGPNNNLYNFQLEGCIPTMVLVKSQMSAEERLKYYRSQEMEVLAYVQVKPYATQFENHLKLYQHFESLRAQKIPHIPRVPRPILGSRNYIVMEKLPFKSVNDVINDPATHHFFKAEMAETAARKNYEAQIISMLREFQNIFFKHNDLHQKNVLLDPKTGNIWIIDFDFSESFVSKDSFNRFTGWDIDGRPFISAYPDHKDWIGN